MLAGGRVRRDPEKQEQSGAGGCGGKTPVLLPGTRKARGPDPPEAQDIQTERFHRVQALGSLLCPDPHKQGTLPPHDFRSGQEVDGPRRVPRVEGGLAIACLELTGPWEDTWALTALHVPERLELELDAVARVLKSGFGPQVGAREGCLPTVPRVAGASTTHFAAGLTVGQEPLRLQNRIFVNFEVINIGIGAIMYNFIINSSIKTVKTGQILSRKLV